METTEIKEIEVPVPWGQIKVKAWGDEKNQPILVIHGRMDNAGAFDRLIPLLPNSFYYLCIDLPGHGKSSHFPPHLPIYTVNYLITYRILTHFFNRKSYIILGHSYGAQMGFLFTQLYPELVDKLIMLDALHTLPVPLHCYIDHLREKIDTNLVIQQKLLTGRQPVYTYEEAFEKLMSGREASPLIPEAARPLLQRGVEPAGENLYRFTLDQRMKSYIDPLHDYNFLLTSIKRNPVVCPVLVILASESTLHHLVFKPTIRIYRNSKNITVKYVNGTHDVHNNNPDVIAPYINKFLLQWKGKL